MSAPPALAREVGLAVRGLIVPVHPGLTVSVPSLDLPRGKVTALLGASASGKSSLLRALGRVERGYFARPDGVSGQIFLPALVDPGDPPPELLAMTRRARASAGIHGALVGFVFQQEGLFPGLDSLGNVRWALDAHGVPDALTRAREALEAVRLGLNRSVATLSGGERKRLALARCIALRPRILLLDEPFTGLDPHALQALYPVLEAERARGATLVMVTHQREDVARLADHLVFLEAGQVLRSGARDELQAAVEAFFGGTT